MMIPQTLFNQNLSVGGISFAGEIPAFTQPKLTVKREKYRGGGMDGEISMDQGMEEMEASFTANGVRPEAMKYFGLADGNAFSGIFRGSFKGQRGDAVGTVATVRGGLVELDPGEWKPGAVAEFKYLVAVTYYKLEIDGVVMHEIDPVNFVRVIDGVDQLAQHRANLGL